jgi:putative phage-type endonuclease
MDSERLEYLKKRQQYLGASDVAAVMGLSPYKTAFQLYNEKTAAEPIDFTNEKIEMGNLLEPVINGIFLKKPEIDEFYMLEEIQKQYTVKDYEFIKATPDIILNPNGTETLIPCDAKNIEVRFGNFENWEIPIDYYCQIQTQILSCNAPYGYLLVLFNGWHFEYFKIERNDKFIELIINSCVDFWENHILVNELPDIITNTDIDELHRDTVCTGIEATPTIIELLKNYSDAKKTISQFNSIVDKLELEIKKFMGKHEILFVGGKKVLSWKKTKNNKRVFKFFGD